MNDLLLVEAEELLTLKEFAHLFKRSLSSVRRAVSRGRLKDARKVGNYWYVLVPTRIVLAMRNRSQLGI
jgi:hypothetical protein